MASKKAMASAALALSLAFAQDSYPLLKYWDYQPEPGYVENIVAKSKKSIKAPDRFGKVVEKHIQGMFSCDYASEISVYDLFHGHLIIKNRGIPVYASIDDLLNDVDVVLYHTDESLKKWRQSDLPADEKAPRSIVGLNDGTILPAKDFISKETLIDVENYENIGTVFNMDLDSTSSKQILDDGQVCGLFYEFYLMQDPGGRYTTGGEKGQRFDIVFTCL